MLMLRTVAERDFRLGLFVRETKTCKRNLHLFVKSIRRRKKNINSWENMPN